MSYSRIIGGWGDFRSEQAMHDNTLLIQYAHGGSEAAFSQIVARHLPLVYRTCRRELHSEALAEDAAQVVFLLLAHKAKTLRTGPSLAGWLYQTAVFVAKDVRKQEARRLRREEAVMQEAVYEQTTGSSEWDSVEPLLNAALSVLKPADRDAVLLRYLEGHTLAETGAVLGVTEDAARMRVTRAVEKLRRYLTDSRSCRHRRCSRLALLTTEAARACCLPMLRLPLSLRERFKLLPPNSPAPKRPAALERSLAHHENYQNQVRSFRCRDFTWHRRISLAVNRPCLSVCGKA